MIVYILWLHSPISNEPSIFHGVFRSKLAAVVASNDNKLDPDMTEIEEHTMDEFVK